MEVQINDYIDFGKLFLDLFKEQEKKLIEKQYQSEYYKQILDFNANAYKDFELLLDECDYSDKEIIFVFGYDFNDANESCTQSTTAEYVIVYDAILDEFTSCEYEQG